MTAKKLDLSFFSLLAANLITLFLAVYYRWSLLELMWIYWFQSVTIGTFNFFRMMTPGLSGGFMPIGIKAFGSKLSGNGADAAFFAFHYGFFHFLYAIFLLAFTFADDSPLLGPTPIFWPSVFGTALMFFVNHAFSFYYNWAKDAPKWTVDGLMFFPYARIIPMHLTLILGGAAEAFFPASPWAIANFPVLLFLGLKTMADLIMHRIEHR